MVTLLALHMSKLEPILHHVIKEFLIILFQYFLEI